MRHLLTVDLEDWYHSISTIAVSEWSEYEPRVLIGTERILEIFKKHNYRATFFVLGAVAAQNPDLIKRLVDEGHEIGSHGYAHRLVYNQSDEEFRQDVERSLEILSPLAGEVRGYRAPWWSITKESVWALPMLRELGFHYDSSIYPAYAGYYGISGAPRFLNRPDAAPELWEVPPLTCKFAGRIWPAGGGFYLRTFPGWFHRKAIRQAERDGHPGMLYLHPWELDPEQPRIKLPFMQGLIHYTRLSKMESSLERLLNEFEFVPVSEGLGLSG
jgi:polysaccharide deacetylase family protein (PEP-CTERM system associated)